MRSYVGATFYSGDILIVDHLSISNRKMDINESPEDFAHAIVSSLERPVQSRKFPAKLMDSSYTLSDACTD